MCGRFALRVDRHQIQDLEGYDAEVDEWIDEEEFIPRYNIAPRTQVPVIRRRDPGSSQSMNNDSHVVIQTMKWGLVPHWSKFEDKTLNTMNARSENLVEGGGMWASIKGKKRCAIPCQGYYEWLTKGKDKLPHFTRRKDGRLLLMAGLYDSVVLEGKTLWTFTIVTTDANKEFSWLHDRQPVFLTNRDALFRWLDTSSQAWTPELSKMVQPYHDASTPLECYQVPKEVGKVGVESSTFIEPITSRKDGIQAMFSKQRQTQQSSSPSKEPPAKRKLESSPSLERIDGHRSPKKQHEMDHADNSNQPKGKKVEVIDVDAPGSSQPDGKVIVKGSPKKRKVVNAPAGNKKISAFFSKS
ncbi:hypothetical protein NLJ89_g3677 [Agrocybe chaxingu]|uniref:DUF159-domain-containing protein n=1 Tax=Agrocybe chaxingu TaxID=84603 RepID=A0A9W8MY72_9AGAR|nr:hypothetical protein NLJ89_g3677 [Agrocybe chaxingu]